VTDGGGFGGGAASAAGVLQVHLGLKYNFHSFLTR
jgi:hypothetical protein